MLFSIPPIHQPFIGMLGVFALLHHLQITIVVIGSLLHVIHAFLAIAFKENRIWISRQKPFIRVEFVISTLEFF